MIRLFFLVSGFLCLFLAILGAFLPLLPTTPFALLAAYLFSKGSPRIHQWCLTLPLIGEAIRDWELSKTISKRSKFLAIGLMSASLIFLWSKPQVMLFIKIFTSIILTFVSLFIIRCPSASAPKKTLQIQ